MCVGGEGVYFEAEFWFGINNSVYIVNPKTPNFKITCWQLKEEMNKMFHEYNVFHKK